LARYGTLVDAWTGLRPMVVHGGPRIGPGGAAGYFLSLGRHRSGILLAPLAAQLLAPVIQGAAPDPLLTPFVP
jgi:glycine oxidase